MNAISHNTLRLTVVLLICHCVPLQPPPTAPKQGDIAPRVQLQLEHCPQQKQLRWRVALGIRHGVDLSQDLPTWPSSYSGTLEVRNAQRGYGMGGGSSHLACLCPDTVCPCDRAMKDGHVPGWQIAGSTDDFSGSLKAFKLKLTLRPGEQILLPLRPSETSSSGKPLRVRGLQMRFDLDPGEPGFAGDCRPIEVRNSKSSYLFHPESG